MSEPITGSPRRDSVLPRLYWMFIGPAALALAAALLVKHPTWSLGWRDLIFWGATGTVVALRYVDVRYFGGSTADGEPATLQHVQRHALLLSLVGIVLWAVVQSIHI